MKFDKYDFAPEIKKSLSEAGFIKPTDIQYRSIPPILEGEDVLAIAQTGTGKTAAFAIPIIDFLYASEKPHDDSDQVRCLVMVPTRELADQIYETFISISKYTDLKIVCTTGGVDQQPQIESLKNGADVLITTPGRLFDLIYQKIIRITKTEIFVLDEADQMLAMGFYKDIKDVKKFLPKRHQTLFFSATINEEIKELAYSVVRNPIRIQVSPKNPVSKNVEHSLVFVSMDDKRFFLERIIREKNTSKILVFVRTKVRAERVYEAMKRVEIETATIHSDKDQEMRSKALFDFKNGTVKVLIATDITARGIDISNVDYVINYDLPEQAENYVHRVGRTGRGNKRGIAVSFCSPEEKNILEEIEDFIGQNIPIVEMSKDDYQATLDFTEESQTNWKALMKEAEKELEQNKKKNKNKKK